MNPWDILGWILVVWIGLMVALKAAIIVLDLYEKARRFLRQYVRHLRTRNTPPATGQRWYGAGYLSYEVTGVYDDGVIGVRHGNTSMGRSPDDWKSLVRRNRLYLLHGTR